MHSIKATKIQSNKDIWYLQGETYNIMKQILKQMTKSTASILVF